MAKLLPIDNIRSGSKGGTTYSHNKGGYYDRLRSVPTNPNSPRQQATRNILATQSAAWKLLTPAQQAAWNAYGELHSIKDSLGQDILIAGQNWFCRINSRLSDAAQATLTMPPIYGAPAGLATMAISYFSDDVISIAFTPTTLPSDALIQLLYTMANSMGSTPNKNQSRMVAYTALQPSSPLQITLPAGVVSGMQSTFFAACLNDQGHMSAFLTDTAAR